MTKKQNKADEKMTVMLWAGTGVLFLGLMFARFVFPEHLWLTILLGLGLVGSFGYLLSLNQKALKSRTAAYGLNSVVTVLLVIGIVGVLNFLASRYPLRFDLTKNKVYTLSDQTVKLIKGLKKPVKATFFAKLQQRDQHRPLFDNYKALNPKFEMEYLDPDKEPTRAKQANIKKYGTLLLTVGTRENKVEDISEEKITNALIKLLKDKSPMLCTITGHGEKSFGSQEQDGYDAVKKALANQSYDQKDISLVQETKVPDSCDAIAIVGPTKSFLEPEVKMIKEYLDNGGRAIVALDINLKGTENTPELNTLLQEWHIKPGQALIVDPLSRLFQVDSSMAILANFSRDNAITKDFQTNCVFPFTRPLELIPGAPAGMNVQWIAQTTPKSWGVTDFNQIAKGEVRFEPGKDKAGPLNAAMAVEGKLKDSKAPKNTRLVVFGTSHFATNNASRMGGNLDFFLNAVSWVMEDESMISIRSKEDGPGKVDLSQKAGTTIFLLTVIAIPLMIAAGGLAIWVYRRRL